VELSQAQGFYLSGGSKWQNAGKTRETKPHGGHMRREEDNIKMDLRKTGWEFAYWIHIVEDRGHWQTIMHTVMKFQVP